jgi:putative SbcD/Mre11-related phosphoesterase
MLVHGEWMLTAERVAVHVPTQTAVAADLHLGYDAARRRRGDAVPITGLDDLLRALAMLAAVHGLRRLVIAGDLFEDAAGLALVPDLLRWLGEHNLELAGVVPGNHDRGLVRGDAGLPVCADGVRLGDWLVVHGDGALPPGRLVLGHFHPCLRWGTRLAAPCYLIGEERLVLPAFSPEAAGVDVLDGRRWRGHRCAVIVGGEVLDFGTVDRLAEMRRR